MFPTSQPNNSEGSVGRPEPPPLSGGKPLQPQVDSGPAPVVESRWRLTSAASQTSILGAIIFLSAFSYYAISRYIMTAVVIQGKSMLPTLHEGDRYLLNRWVLKFRNPQRGDLVVIKDPGHSDLAVKRVIGMPLESVEFKEGKVLINGKRLNEPYLRANTPTLGADEVEKYVLVGRNRYFVLGDNREISEDSRYYGAIRREQIIGLIEE